MPNIAPIQPGRGAQGAGGAAPPPKNGAFAPILQQQLKERANATVSTHARARVEQRGVSLQGPNAERLSKALDRAQEKNIKTSLILLDGVAVLANVAERRIITTMNTAQAKDRVFTNIDGVVLG